MRAIVGGIQKVIHKRLYRGEEQELGGVEMYAAGKRALEQREVVTEGMEGLLAPGYELKAARSACRRWSRSPST